MKIKSPHVLIALVSTLAVLWIGVVDMERTSPGPLAAVHERVADLRDKSGCSGCHGGWFEGMTDSCLECHETIGEQIENDAGLHGALSRDEVTSCARCHSDHHGEHFELVNVASFRAAGFADAASFDHGFVGFDMQGGHLDLACSDCHRNADADVLPEGEFRYGGLTKSCRSCHEDPHEGRMVAGCATCHNQDDFEQLHSLAHEDHPAAPRLVGGHGDQSCRECHADGEPHGLENLSRQRTPPARRCQECHASPHREPFVDGAARLTSMASEASCVVCHEAEHTSFRDEDLTLAKRYHAYSNFRLNPPHDQSACDDCHDPALATFAERYPGRGPNACAACHEDPHGGQFAAGPFAERGCVSCHERQSFEPHAFTLKKHARTSFPLTGSHVDRDCNECHFAPEAHAEKGPRVFAGTASSCESCHEDAHAAYFDERLAAARPDPAGTCAQCHLTTTFAEVPEARFDHGRWTAFPLRGAHVESTCEACHAPRETADAHGRTFGRVEETFGPYAGCVSCHADVHLGRFDGPESPREVDGRKDCARCHAETSFRALPKGFAHELWTGFPLIGRHAQAKCAQCHTPLRAPDETGRTWDRAKGNACADCHLDPHAGQFLVGGKIDCARCHTEETSFAANVFDHAVDSRFPLEGPHVELACAACHQTWRAGEVEVVRYRPLPTLCVDCHGIQEDELRRLRRRQ